MSFPNNGIPPPGFASLDVLPSFFRSPADSPTSTSPSQDGALEDGDVDHPDRSYKESQDSQVELLRSRKREREEERVTSGVGRAESSDGGDQPVASTSAAESPVDGQPMKVRKTRGSKACQACRKIKAKCVGSAHPPCQRCVVSGQECVFTPSKRGKRLPKPPPPLPVAMGRAGIEETLESAFHSFSHTEIVASSAGFVSVSKALESPPHLKVQSPVAEAAASPILATALAVEHQNQMTPALGEATDHGPKLHSLPYNSLNPLGLLAEASRHNTRYGMSLASILESSESVGRDPDSRQLKPDRLGLANKSYFQPNPLNILPLRGLIFNQKVPSEIITSKLLNTEEIKDLFQIYFEHLHPHYAVLCPTLHTPTSTSLRSPFLFSCICTVASKFYQQRTDSLYRKCLRVTKNASSELLAQAYKSPEVVQGFLLLSHWNQPAETYEQELTYQFSGMAIRMATDLNLQRPSTVQLPDNVSSDARERFDLEVMNRERTWFHCFTTDRSISTQMGKPSCIAREDIIIRSAKRWHLKSGAQTNDIVVCAIVELHRVVGRIISVLHSDNCDTGGLPKNLDYPVLTEMFLGLLEGWRDEWLSTGVNLGSPLPEFYYWYFRLFVLSFAVQSAMRDPESAMDLPGYCLMCWDSVLEMIKISRSLQDRGELRYATDATFTCLSYSAVFLLKLVSPTFSKIINEKRLFDQVARVASVLEECAANPTHTPALYAAFIRALLNNRRDPASNVASRAQTRATTPTEPYMAQANDQAEPGPTHIMEPWSEAFGMVGADQGNAMPYVGDHAEDLTQLAVDSLVSNNDFWDSMLMPGFGGPFVGLAGGNGMFFADNGDFNPFSYVMSRPPSPVAMAGEMSFDFVGGST